MPRLRPFQILLALTLLAPPAAATQGGDLSPLGTNSHACSTDGACTTTRPTQAQTPSLGTGLSCTFTTICSPQTDCQTHPGVPFRFDVTSGAFSFMSATGMVFGTPLSHLDPPNLAVMFEVGDTGTLLLTVAQTGDAVMTQQDVLPAGTVQSVSYYGTCEPGA